MEDNFKVVPNVTAFRIFIVVPFLSLRSMLIRGFVLAKKNTNIISRTLNLAVQMGKRFFLPPKKKECCEATGHRSNCQNMAVCGCAGIVEKAHETAVFYFQKWHIFTKLMAKKN